MHVCVQVLRCPYDNMSSSGKKRKDSPSGKEGLTDSTARSHYVPEGKSIKSKPTRIPIEWVRPRYEIIFMGWIRLTRMMRNEIDLRKKNTNKVEKEIVWNYHLRKVSAVRDFPPGYERGAAPVSKEEFERQ
ncbi:Uncharacterized protein TCM_017542 [Theobroma cacao]|uniref:Uncharacterized protein n=1 Tax=Theobroma cacao TaxID=3641 RepID=A0A061EEP4_THECC|nr:Uncharacterized protein TCM_017542 [Theobroma cacao]